MPGIPYIGVSLSDLTFIDEGGSDFVEGNLINFSKWKLVYFILFCFVLFFYFYLFFCFSPNFLFQRWRGFWKSLNIFKRSITHLCQLTPNKPWFIFSQNSDFVFFIFVIIFIIFIILILLILILLIFILLFILLLMTNPSRIVQLPYINMKISAKSNATFIQKW